MKIWHLLHKCFLVTGFILLSQSTLAARYYINWDKVKLVDATGIPDSNVHEYKLNGSLVLGKTTTKKGWFSTSSKNTRIASMWVTVSGRWDQRKNTATESIIFSGDQKGSVSSVLRCNEDPWLNNSPGCSVISVNVQSQLKQISDWPSVMRKYLKPLTHQSVTLSNANRLSSNASRSAAPPPPPPPANKPKSFAKVKKAKPALNANAGSLKQQLNNNARSSNRLPSGLVKSCAKNVSATLNISSLQFRGNSGPAKDVPKTRLKLNLVSSQAINNQFYCTYSGPKNFAETKIGIVCKTAKRHRTEPHSYHCAPQ